MKDKVLLIDDNDTPQTVRIKLRDLGIKDAETVTDADIFQFILRYIEIKSLPTFIIKAQKAIPEIKYRQKPKSPIDAIKKKNKY